MSAAEIFMLLKAKSSGHVPQRKLLGHFKRPGISNGRAFFTRLASEVTAVRRVLRLRLYESTPVE